MSCSIGHRHDSDTMWLWFRPAAVALIQPLAWKPPYATGAALKKKKTEEQLFCPNKKTVPEWRKRPMFYFLNLFLGPKKIQSSN